MSLFFPTFVAENPCIKANPACAFDSIFFLGPLSCVLSLPCLTWGFMIDFLAFLRWRRSASPIYINKISGKNEWPAITIELTIFLFIIVAVFFMNKTLCLVHRFRRFRFRITLGFLGCFVTVQGMVRDCV